MVTPRGRVQAQLREKRGGASDAILLAVARRNVEGRGKDYYAPTHDDLSAASKAHAKAKSIIFEMPKFPQNDTRAFPPGPYGITTWADVLAPRQKFSRWVIHEVIEDAIKEAGKQVKDKDLLNALAACLYTAYSDNAQYHTSLCVWLSEGVTSIFIQGSGVPMRADFVEGNPLSPNCEGLGYSARSVRNAIRHLASVRYQPSSPLLANALDSIMPDESMDVIFTDPPYANQIPYAHLSDFFYGWLRLGMQSRMPQAFTAPETEKTRELTENRAVKDGGLHDRQWYERHMRDAFGQMKRTIREDGIASVVFAHKDTDRWEALVSALVQAGWRTTGSWPIATERKQRMRGQGYAALETSVHLVCRPRPENAPVGEWGNVLSELPNRVGDWMERLQSEGIRGADLVFACIGPALEIFSRYSKVETAEGREVRLAEYLEKVWEVVGRTALEHILGTAEAKARNGAAGALEEDARLTALFLWTLQSTNEKTESTMPKRAWVTLANSAPAPTTKLIAPAGTPDWGAATDEEREKYAFIGHSTIGDSSIGAESEDDAGEDIDEEESSPRTSKTGFSLPFDVARRFAQPLGIHLPEWEGRIVKTEKGVVHLIPISDRAKVLFGEEGAEAVADRLEKDPTSAQLSLFESVEASVPELKVRGHKKKGADVSDEQLKTRREATTLDRVHAAMILQASGRANALRALFKAEQDRGPDFLRLANSLTALYPRGSEEKRLLDAMLLAVPR